jgi:hypothetical protein
MDQEYIFSGIECGACNGSGYVEDSEPLVTEYQEEQELGEEIAKVLKYYAHPQVAWIELTGEMQIGETVRVKGSTTDFTTVISSIRIDDVNVETAGFGQQAGVWVPHRVRHNDRIYSV